MDSDASSSGDGRLRGDAEGSLILDLARRLARWSKRMTLEQAIAYIQDDELVEVTPKVIRIRKAQPLPESQSRQP
jgi:predicted membrane GTPase involved in stress response